MITIESTGKESTDWQAKLITLARVVYTSWLLAGAGASVAEGRYALTVTITACLITVHYWLNEKVKEL